MGLQIEIKVFKLSSKIDKVCSIHHIFCINEYNRFQFPGYDMEDPKYHNAFIDNDKYYFTKSDLFHLKFINKMNKSVIPIRLKVESNVFPINSYERSQMIIDLENFNKELIKNKKVSYEYDYSHYSLSNFNKIVLINLLRDNGQIFETFRHIINAPSFKNNVIYLRSKDPKPQDSTSIKLNILNPSLNGKYYPVKHISYNLEENRLVKRMLNSIHSALINSISYFRSKYDENKQLVNDYYLCISCLKKELLKLNYINSLSPFNELSNVVTCYFPKKMMLSPKYNLFYRQFKNIFSGKLIQDEYKYTYSNKSTYFLYEVWTYISVITSLINNGYKLVKISSEDNKMNILKYLLYGIKTGTIFRLNKSDLTLNVIYNESIDYSKSSPLIISNNNYKQDKILFNKASSKIALNKRDDPKDYFHDTPDIRIDIYNHNYYIDSIILDAKCMFRDNVINKVRDVNQLLSYRYNALYRSPKGHFSKEIPESLNPIKYVFVLFPKFSSYKGDINKTSKHEINGINYQQALPYNEIMNEFSNKLMNAINHASELDNNI